MSGIKRWKLAVIGSGLVGMDKCTDGVFVNYEDHAAEIARLRAEADALRAKCDELSMLHVAAVQDKAHLEIKYRNACARADAKHSAQKLVGYRWRHSAGEKWQYSDIPCGWEYEPLYAAMGADA